MVERYQEKCLSKDEAENDANLLKNTNEDPGDAMFLYDTS